MATNFRKGDKVKMVMIDTRWPDYVDVLAKFLGSIGTIIGNPTYYNDEYHRVLIRFDSCYEWYVDPDWLEMVKAASRGWTGKVICTSRKHPENIFFSVGKVYNVVEGKLYSNDDTTGTGYYTSGLKSFDDLVKDTKDYYDFIEFKGFANS